MRYSLRTVFPDIFRTILVPKKEELVATPYHFDGDNDVAKEFLNLGCLKHVDNSICMQGKTYL